MVKVCINGGGVAGLTTALLLAADGHEVTVVERDSAPPGRDPRSSWEGWDHRSVRQLRQTHAYLPRFRNVLLDDMPHVYTRLLEAGVPEYDLLANAPESVGDVVPRAGDEQLKLLLGRRTTVDAVLHHAAADDPRIEVLAGVTSKGLEATGAGGESRVTALATSAGPVDADVVVDCGGARSAMPDWVEEISASRPEETSNEFRIAYWTQWFRPKPGCSAPVLRGLPVVYAGPFMMLRAPADHGWWSATLIAPADDRRFRVLADQSTLLRVLRALPPTRDWVDPARAEPVGEIVPMFIPFDGRRRYVVDDRPALGGTTGVGDAVGVTNPTLGRGVSFAAMHAAGLRDVLRTTEDPAEVSLRHHRFLETEFHPWWQETVESDRETLHTMRALVAGEEPPPPGRGAMLRHVAEHDPEIFRALMAIASVVERPEDVLARPGLLDRIQETMARVGPPVPIDVDLDRLLAPAEQVEI